MPEATMICCDSSEYMRNGDFQPNRFDAQKDALSIICSAKTEQNRENTVGLICMGKDEKAEVLVNCTTDVGRILQNAHKMKIFGKSNILVALQTAQLALKHRKNKKQTQRIIVFVGSPVKLKPKQLQKVGKRLKKNNVAVDIINFGESQDNLEILQGFIKCVNSNNNSHLVNVESNTDQLLSDVLISSSLFARNQEINDLTGQPVNNTGQPNVPSNQPQSQYEVINGIRREDDPELWEAMKQSMLIEEERIKSLTTNDNNDNNNNNNSNNNNDNNQNNDNNDNEIDEEDEELMRALQMSIEENPVENTENNDNQNNENNQNDVDVEMNDSNLEDGNLLGQLIEGLPGLNDQDIDVDQLLQSVDEDEDKDKDNKDKKNDDKDPKNDDKN